MSDFYNKWYAESSDWEVQRIFMVKRDKKEEAKEVGPAADIIEAAGNENERRVPGL